MVDSGVHALNQFSLFVHCDDTGQPMPYKTFVMVSDHENPRRLRGLTPGGRRRLSPREGGHGSPELTSRAFHTHPPRTGRPPELARTTRIARDLHPEEPQRRHDDAMCRSIREMLSPTKKVSPPLRRKTPTIPMYAAASEERWLGLPSRAGDDASPQLFEGHSFFVHSGTLPPESSPPIWTLSMCLERFSGLSNTDPQKGQTIPFPS